MNRRKKAAWSMASFLAVSLGAIPAHAWTGDTRFQVEFETGAVWQSRNEIHIRTLQTGHGSTFGSCRAAVRKFSGGGTHVECGAPPFHTIRLCAAEFFRHRVVCQPGAFRRVHVCFRDGNRLGLPL